MRQIDTLITPEWIVPVEPPGAVLSGHSVAVDNGRILDILPTPLAEGSLQASDHRRLPGHALLPGLVNAHTHAAMTLFRGLADDLPLEVWLREHIWPAEQRWVSPEFVRTGTELAIAEMIRSGTTCFNDMYFFPDVAGRAAVRFGMRACVGLIVIEAPTAWATSPDEYLARAAEVHDEFRHEPLVTTAFAPHAPYTVSDETLARVRTLSEELDIPVHIHLHETRSEVEAALEAGGERPFRRLARLGLVSPRLCAVHMTELTEEEIDGMAREGGHVVHCPESNLKLASGICPVARLRAHGVEVAIGTDGAASNNDLDMVGEMRTASLLGKWAAGDASAVGAPEVLRAATLGGARALGLGEVLGSLEPGKLADLVAVDLGAPATQPVHDVVSQLVYAATREQVRDVWVGGVQLLSRGHLMRVELEELMERVRHWGERIRAADRAGGTGP